MPFKTKERIKKQETFRKKEKNCSLISALLYDTELTGDPTSNKQWIHYIHVQTVRVA